MQNDKFTQQMKGRKDITADHVNFYDSDEQAQYAVSYYAKFGIVAFADGKKVYLFK